MKKTIQNKNIQIYTYSYASMNDHKANVHIPPPSSRNIAVIQKPLFSNKSIQHPDFCGNHHIAFLYRITA